MVFQQWPPGHQSDDFHFLRRVVVSRLQRSLGLGPVFPNWLVPLPVGGSPDFFVFKGPPGWNIIAWYWGPVFGVLDILGPCVFLGGFGWQSFDWNIHNSSYNHGSVLKIRLSNRIVTFQTGRHFPTEPWFKMQAKQAPPKGLVSLKPLGPFHSHLGVGMPQTGPRHHVVFKRWPRGENLTLTVNQTETHKRSQRNDDSRKIHWPLKF